MQELSNEIREVTTEGFLGIEEHLRETAKKWAAYVLEKNCDDALEKGLKISQALCDYLNEIKIQD